MSFTKVYPMLIAKAEKKDRTKDEVLEVTSWLTGYTFEQIEQFLDSDISYGDFFLCAPMLNPDQKMITGTVCGVRVENIEEPLMQEIRYLDKLVDELAKGKTMEKILRKQDVIYIVPINEIYCSDISLLFRHKMDCILISPFLIYMRQILYNGEKCSEVLYMQIFLNRFTQLNNFFRMLTHKWAFLFSEISPTALTRLL